MIDKEREELIVNKKDLRDCFESDYAADSRLGGGGFLSWKETLWVGYRFSALRFITENRQREAELQADREKIANGIFEIAKSLGICNSDCDLSGAHLLLLCEDVKQEHIRLQSRLAEMDAREPVAIVDASDDGYFAEILPNVSVKIGQHLYASPQESCLSKIDKSDNQRDLTLIGESEQESQEKGNENN